MTIKEVDITTTFIFTIRYSNEHFLKSLNYFLPHCCSSLVGLCTQCDAQLKTM